jgi:hypothetical protein
MLPAPVRVPSRASSQWQAATTAALNSRSAPTVVPAAAPASAVPVTSVPVVANPPPPPPSRPQTWTTVPDSNPFSSRDHQIEGLYELEGTNYALYEAMKIDDPAKRAEFDNGVHDSAVRQIAFNGFAANPADLWIQVRPGVIETILIGSVTTQMGSTPVISDAKWPLRVRVVVRCNPHDAGRVGRALSDMGRSDLFHHPLRLYQSWFKRALGSCLVRMVPPDSPETPVGPVTASSNHHSRKVVMRVDDPPREEVVYRNVSPTRVEYRTVEEPARVEYRTVEEPARVEYRTVSKPRVEYRTVEYDEPTLVSASRVRVEDQPATIYRSATPTRVVGRSVSRKNAYEGDVYSEYRERGSPRTPLPVDSDSRYVRVTEPRDRW